MLARSEAMKQYNNLIAGNDPSDTDLKQIISDVLVRNAVLEHDAGIARSAASRAKKRAKTLATALASKNVSFAESYNRGDARGDALPGKGFGQSARNNAIRDFVDSLRQRWPGNLTKQLTVVTGLARRFDVDLRAADTSRYTLDGRLMTQAEVDTCVCIAKAKRAVFKKLRALNPSGRYSNDLATVVHGNALGACVQLEPEDAPRVGVSRIANFLHTTPSLLYAERRKWVQFVENNGNAQLAWLRCKQRSDKYPDEWREFVIAHWKSPEVTRRSEKARDNYISKAHFGQKVTVPRFLLETRQKVAISKIISAWRKKFGPTFEYKDRIVRDGEVTMSEEFVRQLKPFNVKYSFGDRETSLCRYHMAYEFLAAAVYTWQKQLRNRAGAYNGVPMTVPKDAYGMPPTADCPEGRPGLRRLLVCPRVPATARHDNLDCLKERCVKCKDLQLLDSLIPAAELEAGKDIPVKWERWSKWKDANGKMRKDFKTQTGVIADVIAELRSKLTHKKGHPTWWADFKEHHDLMKHMDDDKSYVRNNFPRGTVHIIEDFSENGELGKMKLEHQSRYYETRGYTLFGMVVASHVEDHDDTSIPAAEKKKLIDMMDELRPGKPHVVIEMHVCLSEDTHHDPAAVQYFNDVILMPYLLKNINGLKRVHYCCDGAPTQFDNKDMYLWVSKFDTKWPGVTIDYIIGCAAHNKDLSDGECGLCKNCINRVNAEHLATDLGRQQKIDTVPDVKAYLEKEMARPTKTLRQRGGKGIYRRLFHHVPLRTIPRRLPAACTINGSKKIHQFISVGVPGLLLWRRRPCHQCPGCRDLDPTKIIRECKHNDRCGRAKYVKVLVKSNTDTVVTRAAAQLHGRGLGDEAAVGDFLAVQSADDVLPWAMGEVIAVLGNYDGSVMAGCDGTDIKPGDPVVHVRRWLPLQVGGGSSIYEPGDDVFPVRASTILFRIPVADADGKKMFKKTRANVVVTCSKGHILKNKGVQPTNNCEVCGARGTTWTCDAAECKYDICSPCRTNKLVRRQLDPDVKKLVYRRMPNCDDDPFSDVDGGPDWYGEYKVTRAGMLVSEVAAELKVSIFSLIDHNGNIGLEPSSPLRKGTTLWRPGPRPANWEGPSLSTVLEEEEEEDEDNSLWDEDAGSEGDSDGDSSESDGDGDSSESDGDGDSSEGDGDSSEGGVRPGLTGLIVLSFVHGGAPTEMGGTS